MKRHLAISLLTVSLLTSCVSFQEFQIDVYQPANITIPSEIKSITLVPRNLKFANDTLQHYHQKNYRLVKDKPLFNADSIAVSSCLKALAEELKKNNRFESVHILPYSSVPPRTVRHIKPLSRESIQKIAKKTSSAGIVVLDMFSAFYSFFPQSMENYSYANVVTANVWTIYDANQADYIDRYSFVDTLYWDKLDSQGNYVEKKIPGKKEALIMAADVIGKNYSKRLVPSWGRVYRSIMTSNKPDFKQAALYVNKNQWEKAKPLWAKHANSKNPRLKLQALYNLAVASEMEGKLDQAAAYLNTALTTHVGSSCNVEIKMIRKYMAVVFKRNLDLEKIHDQLEGY